MNRFSDGAGKAHDESFELFFPFLPGLENFGLAGLLAFGWGW